jgi:hypothetical protein
LRKSFKGSEQTCSWCVHLPVDYQGLAVAVIKEVVGVAGTLWPHSSGESKKILSDVEEASLNKERLVLVRKLLNEVKTDTKCSSCIDHVNKAEEEIAWLEKKVPTIERVARLRENLRNLLEEAQSELPLVEEPLSMGSKPIPSVKESLGARPPSPSSPGPKPESGKSYSGQTSEAYCVECVEGHTMKSLTELRHAIDRYRTSGEMNEGVVEKVRVSIGELTGIDEDVKNVENAKPEVKQALNKILDKARWIRKEYGLGGKGLTAGRGDMKDLEQLRNDVGELQVESYQLIKNCPLCLKKIA